MTTIAPDDPTRIDRLPPRVLVVDDDAAVGDALVRILNRWGYLVATASNITEGVRMTLSWRPAVVVLDLRLGDEDGRALLEVLDVLADPRPAVLVCTGVLGAELPLGADALVAKPFELRELVQRVHDLARSGPLRDLH
jgi:DNA-binding response OmpR family regulator